MIDFVEELIQTIEKDGIILKDRQYVYNSIKQAIKLGHFEFIPSGTNRIGWFTWELRPDEVFINNLFIHKEYRKTFNLRWGLRYLMEQYKEMGAFSWVNRKKNKPMKIMRKTLCSQ